MENLREQLYNIINELGLDYEKIISVNRELHKEIIKNQISMIKGAK